MSQRQELDAVAEATLRAGFGSAIAAIEQKVGYKIDVVTEYVAIHLVHIDERWLGSIGPCDDPQFVAEGFIERVGDEIYLASERLVQSLYAQHEIHAAVRSVVDRKYGSRN